MSDDERRANDCFYLGIDGQCEPEAGKHLFRRGALYCRCGAVLVTADIVDRLSDLMDRRDRDAIRP